ncbi:MAG: hypothetical protein WBA93_20140 [Microcoleaceae cyanobacterium]
MSPISNSWLNQGVAAILSGIQELELNASGGGSASYRYAKSARVLLRGGEAAQVLPGTSEPVDREVSIRLVNGTSVNLWWEGVGEAEQSFLELTPQFPEFRDVSDGGLRINAFSPTVGTELVILIRQNVPINYNLGGDEVANVNVSLWVSTTAIYSNDISNFSIVNQVDNITGSDDSIAGHKLFWINGFTPGEKVKFNIDAASNIYGGNKIEMQFIKPLDLMMLLFKSGINNFLNIDIPTLLSGQGDLGKLFNYMGKTDSSTGGELVVKPYYDSMVGRFTATNSFSGKGDTCIITDYQPNLQFLKEGGTFTLRGF